MARPQGSTPETTGYPLVGGKALPHRGVARPAAGDGRYRVAYKHSTQLNRAAGYGLGVLIALLFRSLGVLEITWAEIALVGTAAIGSAALFAAVASWHLDDRLHVDFHWLWLVSDVGLITWAVVLTGGGTSPWFPWYLANVAGAAFVKGSRGAAVMALADTVAYLAVLALIGDVSGLDQSLYRPLASMVFLFGASFIFLRGVSLLQERRRVIRRLQEAESRRVEELTRLTAALDQRTRELADANLKIREADRAKSQFLANMSHELRTPLNSIIGFSDVLLARLADQLNPKHLRFLENVNTSGQHLLGIINDILDLSKIEAGKLELLPEVFPLGTVVEGVCTVMKGVAARRGIEFDIEIAEDLPPIEADPVKVKQTLYNLLSNAVKFSPDGSTVRIAARRLPAEASPLEEESVEVTVVDHGIGIHPREHRLIFEEFTQADSSAARQAGGTGLGLTLVKRFLELHRGQVRVESALGEGSTFTVTLPRRFAGEATVSEIVPEPLQLPREGGTRILVVEDDPTVYESLSRHLSAASYIPVRARTVDEAVRLARVLLPAAITLDIILPGGDGWEILRQLKEDELTATIPVVIVSMVENRELGLALGAADYFLKPVDGEALAARLSELVPRDSDVPPHLLLVDDDPHLHEILDAKLQPLGYRLEHALTGREALERARSEPPSLVILDLMMEEMDGFEVAAQLKASPSTARVPIVVFTAKDMSAHERATLKGKIAALVLKGESPNASLVAVIEDVLARQRKGAAHAAE